MPAGCRPDDQAVGHAIGSVRGQAESSPDPPTDDGDQDQVESQVVGAGHAPGAKSLHREVQPAVRLVEVTVLLVGLADHRVDTQVRGSGPPDLLGEQPGLRHVADRHQRPVQEATDRLIRLDPAPGEEPHPGQRTVELTLVETAHRFRAGHRIRLQVSGGAHPRYARNLGTGEPLGEATGGVPTTHRICVGGATPSSVSLPTA